MKRSALTATRRTGLLFLLAGGLLAMQAGTALAGGGQGNDVNTLDIHVDEQERPGTATATGGGSATAGTATVDRDVDVVQRNIQLVAGGYETRAASSQKATNETTLDQKGGAASGEAIGADGGTAISGDATAKLRVVVRQMNIQIIIGIAPECGVKQAATNTARIMQTILAATGRAAASGANSAAISGDATAQGLVFVRQWNVQVYVGTGQNEACTRVKQKADNEEKVEQLSGALSGKAEAGPRAQATTGDTQASNVENVRQTNRQVVSN